MAITTHPLTEGKLGQFLSSETLRANPENEHVAKFRTMFYYERGVVTLEPDWKYVTHMDAPEYHMDAEQLAH